MATQEARHARGPDRRQQPRSWDDGGHRGNGQAGDERLSRALGWFSIGLGLAELTAPNAVARLIGIPEDDSNRRMLRAFGMRELANGVGILAQPRESGWMWARVGGDLMDLAFLGNNLRSDEAQPNRIAAAAAAVAGVTALDVLCGQRMGQDGGEAQGTGANRLWSRHIDVRQTVAINRKPEEIYSFWRDFRNLPQFMSHLERVDVQDDRRSHWVAKAPAGRTVEWDAEVTEDQPNQRLCWRSLERADVDNSGEVRFERAPGDRGTILRVEMRYTPPGGIFGAIGAKLFGEEPQMQVRDDLRRLKQVLETGEVTVAEGSMAITHPAQAWAPHTQPAHTQPADSGR
ncbi:SRPBCC family protein [Azospirillum canadense]|uniref:SRPBCC family protein n=1 Tax=Azospirillum canadense TaxID=403962 RepID=UPI0022278FBF|nr:SRPBCC family protein [Azospirillum canadense]MCW2237566.1 putative membrane protein [Azospirillum canadense]